MKYWFFDPAFIAFMILLCAGYLWLSNGRLKAEAGYFGAALLLILICTCSPLHMLAENYLFSAHMAAHITLFLLVAPLLVLSVPPSPSSNTMRALMNFSRRVAAAPWIAWLSGIGAMWFWHIPAVFDAGFHMQGMLHSGAVGGGLPALLHYTENFSLIIIGILFCWPVIGPFASYRLQPLKGVIYLFTACISCSLLGVLITFSPVGIYKHYLSAADVYGFSSLIRKAWNITPAADQQMAGLIMWVPGCLIYLAGSLYLIRNWFRENENAPKEKENPLTFKAKNI